MSMFSVNGGNILQQWQTLQSGTDGQDRMHTAIALNEWGDFLRFLNEDEQQKQSLTPLVMTLLETVKFGRTRMAKHLVEVHIVNPFRCVGTSVIDSGQCPMGNSLWSAMRAACHLGNSELVSYFLKTTTRTRSLSVACSESHWNICVGEAFNHEHVEVARLLIAANNPLTDLADGHYSGANISRLVYNWNDDLKSLQLLEILLKCPKVCSYLQDDKNATCSRNLLSKIMIYPQLPWIVGLRDLLGGFPDHQSDFVEFDQTVLFELEQALEGVRDVATAVAQYLDIYPRRRSAAADEDNHDVEEEEEEEAEEGNLKRRKLK